MLETRRRNGGVEADDAPGLNAPVDARGRVCAWRVIATGRGPGGRRALTAGERPDLRPSDEFFAVGRSGMGSRSIWGGRVEVRKNGYHLRCGRRVFVTGRIGDSCSIAAGRGGAA